MSLRTTLALLVACLVATVAATVGLTAVPAGADPAVSLSTTINGQDAGDSSTSHPVVLQPDQPATIDMEVTNDTGDPVTLKAVRVTGVVIGLTFFAYQTSVDLTVDAGQTTHLRYVLDLSGLDGQATGLIPARISVVDASHHVVASQSFVSDVRGSIKSVYGLFGLALLALTGLAVAGVLWAVASHRMPRNRWRRGLRLLTVGLGVGLVMVFTLSAFRVRVPSPGRWLVTVLVFAAIFFVIGYLTPTPSSPDDDDELDESEFAAADDGPAAASSASPPPPPPPPPVSTSAGDGAP